MTNQNDIAVKVPLKFSSLIREANSKHKAPFVGFSIEGTRPVTFRRKILAAILDGLTDARVWAEIPGEGWPRVRIESLDGKRKYMFWSQDSSVVRDETKLFSKRKAASNCRANGWKRVSEFTEGTDSVDGEKTVYYLKAGLKIVGSTVYHAASGKSVVVARNHQQAFVAAERALAVFQNWEQDAESLLESLGLEGREKMKLIQTEIKYGKSFTKAA